MNAQASMPLLFALAGACACSSNSSTGPGELANEGSTDNSSPTPAPPSSSGGESNRQPERAASALESGLDADKAGASLSTAEVRQLCQARENYLWSILTPQQTCKRAGVDAAITANIFDNDVNDACVATSMNCLADPFLPDGCELESMHAVAECSTSVAELEACIKAMADRDADVLYRMPDCETMPMPPVNIQRADNIAPAECSAAGAQCREIMLQFY